MGFRKRKIATPGFGHTPYNPIQGEQANLRQDGTSPWCAMMQVAAEDTYDDYVICRGFDTRILKFIDYAVGDPNKPGISVAKPFGKRRTGTYEVGEIYPAFLPTQGNADFADFRRVPYTPPVPVDVEWRVGQNPGVVTGGGLDGGQPADLAEAIELLYDHNSKVINWLLIDSDGSLRMRHVKNGGSSIAAFNEGTGAMSSGTVTKYDCSLSGVLSSAATTFTAYNPGGLIAANAYGIVELNEAGLWVFILVKCNQTG